MKIQKFAALLVLGTLFIAPGAHAQVQVLTGGIGDGGIAAMEEQQQGYSFKAVFSGQRGIYLSNVNAQIVDRQNNEIVNVVTEGPVLLATLPPGRYTLLASLGDHQKRTNFTVGNRGLKTLQVSFPVRDTAEYTNQDGPRRGPEPYYDPDYQARGYYPNSYYDTHTDWQTQQRGYDNGVYGAYDSNGNRTDSAVRDDSAPPGMAMEGTHAARGKDQQQP